MLSPKLSDYWVFSPTEKPRLVVVIDTEEEFDWDGGFSSRNTSVKSLRSIHNIQRVFDEYKITPVYVIDYPVVSQKEGFQPLKEIHADGRCVIGSHLHPWVNPPFTEAVNRPNSFPGNLSRAMEAAKLQVLTDAISEHFGTRPTIYKAGRYGLGPHTAEILEEQGYEVDMSVCPHMDYSAERGPDFTSSSAWPYWFGRERRMLELPLTVGFAGLLRRWGPKLHLMATRRPMASLRAAGILARLGLVNKIWLSPEGYLGSELIALVHALHREGLRIFSLAFHSPSLDCGNTPYVRSESERQAFFSRCRKFFDFFMGDLGGLPTTPLELKVQLAQSASTLRGITG